MTDLTIEHDGETLYVVPGTEMPAGAPCKGRCWPSGLLYWSDEIARPYPEVTYAVTLAQRIAMLGMVAAKGDGVVPADWDRSKPVLFRNGGVIASGNGCTWSEVGNGTIVAYTPLAKPAAPALPKITEKQAQEAYDAARKEWAIGAYEGSFAVFLARRLGILIEPTPPDPYDTWCAAHGTADGQPVTRALYERLQGGGGVMGNIRCVEGRLLRHDPMPDDPYLETDIGECPDCSGDGCGDDGEPVDKPGRSAAWYRGSDRHD